MSASLAETLIRGGDISTARDLLIANRVVDAAHVDTHIADIQAKIQAKGAPDSKFEDYQNYLTAIFRPGDTLCFVGIVHNKDKGKERIENDFVSLETAVSRDYFNELSRANEDGSIYVATNTFPAQLIGQKAGRTQENVVAVRAVQADVDYNGEATISAIKSSELVPEPSIVVESSPNKFQGIWLVDDLSKQDAKPLMQAIAANFNTDSAVAEVARVMRVPGFANRKYESAPVAKTVSQSNIRYRRENFRITIPKAEHPGVDASVNGAKIPHGQHDTTLLKISRKLRGIGLERDAIYDALVEIVEKRCENYGSDYLQMCEKHADGVMKFEPNQSNELALTQTASTSTQQAVATIDASDWRVHFKSVGELEAGEPRMLIHNFLPEGTVFIGALAGEGKTLLGLSIAKALTTGKSFLNQYDFSVPEVVPVLYLIPESGGRAFRKRCETFQIPNDPKLFLARTISEGGTLLLNNPWVLEAVKEMKPVVILDTLIRFSEADDENQASQNKQMVDDIIRLRQAGATAVIGMHHATKAMREKGMSLETALRGTGDIAAAADAVYGMLRDSKLYADGNGPNEIDVACLKPRDFEPPKPFRIAASEKTEDLITGMPLVTSVIDQLHDFRVVSPRTKAANLDQKIAEMIAQDPNVSRKVLMDETGASEWEIKLATKRLGFLKGRGGASGVTTWQKAPKTDGER